jgi:hypothetical protein
MRRSHIWAIIVVAGGIGLVAGIIIATPSTARELRAAQQGQQRVAPLEKLPYTFDFDGPHYPEPNLVFEGPFPKVPQTMMVYQVKGPTVTEEYVRELAHKHFGMPADAELRRSDGMGLYWLRSSTHELEVFPRTNSFNIRRLKKQDKRTIEISCPSKEEGKNIAEQYLKRRGLLPKDAYLWRVIRKPGKGVVRVGCSRKIGPYKTSGAGAKLFVTVGPEGEVIDVRKSWQDLVPYKAYPIKSPQDALAELQQGKGVLINGDTGKVKEITLRYYTSPQKQEYVQPIYYFECTGESGRFGGELPAIKAEYLRPREDGHAAMAWMMCRECGAKYKMKLKQWQAVAESYIEGRPDSRTPPSLVCQECGKKAAYMAIECEKCGLIFEAGWKGPDYYDRCPQCNFSKIEERMKERESRPSKPE